MVIPNLSANCSSKYGVLDKFDHTCTHAALADFNEKFLILLAVTINEDSMSPYFHSCLARSAFEWCVH